jgi:hypothetical protein
MNAATALNAAENGPPAPGQGWSRPRMLRLIAVVFLAHVALIFIFGARKPVVPRPAKDVPQLTLAGGQNELLALTDPTLFALPHADEFTPPFQITNTFHWPNPMRWLSLTDTLAGTADSLAQPVRFDVTHLDFKPQPKLNVPDSQFPPAFPQTSTVRLAGDLARRQWVAAPQLPSWIDNDVLQPTIVQVLVDAEGNVVSDVLQPERESEPVGADQAAADQKALELARGTHFLPAARPTLGLMIFDWLTLPVPATNSPAASP